MGRIGICAAAKSDLHRYEPIKTGQPRFKPSNLSPMISGEDQNLSPILRRRADVLPFAHASTPVLRVTR